VSQTITYAGVDVGGHIKLPEGITGMTSHADGTFGAGEAHLDDPDGEFDLLSLQEFIHEESACDPPRTFTGFLAQRRLSRDTYGDGAARGHDLDILDLNYLLHLQPLRGATAKRPVETGDERMAWLMASVAMSGIVFDNGLIGSNPNSFDEADYTHQYADDVLRDLSVSSSAEVGRIFFVYYDHDTEQPSLFMDRPTVTSYTSTLSISNDLSDQSATCLAPYRDAELSSSGEDIYCSVFFKYKTGTVFRHNDATHATYFNGKGYHRQGVFETTRVGSQETAIRHADAWLANHSGDIDTVTCQLLVPASQVNLIEAGMRVNCKFTHFPGFDTFGYLRVASRTVGLYPVNDLYEMRLVLTNRTITPAGTGSGSTGDFPHIPGQPAVVQTGCGYSLGTIVSLTFPQPISAGHMLVAWIVSRGSSTFVQPPDGTWTTIASGDLDTGLSQSPVAMFAKIADGTEAGLTTLGFQSTNGSSRPRILGWELAGVGMSTHDASAFIQTGTSFALPSLTQDAAGLTIVGISTGSDSPEPANITPHDNFYVEGGDGFWATALGADKIIASASSQVYSGSFTVAGGNSTWAGVAAFFPADTSDNPPSSGQWVYGERLSMSGAVGTTQFAYAAGSTKVRVDGVLISSAAYAETDPSAGTVTLSWTPDADEVVTIDYQGI